MSDVKAAGQRDDVFALAVGEYSRISHEHTMLAASGMKEMAQQVLRGIFIMNGGGIVATMTFLASFAEAGTPGLEPALFVAPLWCFAGGLLLSPVAMFSAYLNFQQNYPVRIGRGASMAKLLTGEVKLSDLPDERVVTPGIRWSMLVAIGACLVSMVSFFFGCLFIGEIFSVGARN